MTDSFTIGLITDKNNDFCYLTLNFFKYTSVQIISLILSTLGLFFLIIIIWIFIDPSEKKESRSIKKVQNSDSQLINKLIISDNIPNTSRFLTPTDYESTI